MRGRAVALAAMLAGPACAALSPGELAGAGVTPLAGAALPAGQFVDQNGRPFRIARADMPTVLLFADFTCAHLCGPGLTLTAGAFHDAGLVAGHDYRMIVIGLDQDGPAAARALIATHLRGLPNEVRALRVLTGDPAAVGSAERELGYRAVYDPAADQFAHSAVSYVFAPDGHLARLLPETAVTPDLAKAAIRDAAAGSRPAPDAIGRFVTLCYGLAAAHGVYGPAIVAALRIAGALTIGTIGFVVWRLSRRGASA